MGERRPQRTSTDRPSVFSLPAGRSRREEILDAAASVFAERGFSATTMDAVGAACGVSGPALYHHFASKESILGEMLVAISRHLVTQGASIVAEGRDPSSTVAGLVDAHVDFAVTRAELIAVQFRDLIHADERDQRVVRRLQRQYVELWVEALVRAAPGVDVSQARATVHAMFGLLHSTQHSTALPAAPMRELLRALAWRLLDPGTLTDALPPASAT